MAVRMVIGRAGTGKTTLCVREIRAAMAQDPLGPPLLWITPEQATFSAERLLLTAPEDPAGVPIRGTFRAQVLSFRRLALMIARDTGILTDASGRAAKPMDEVARLLLLEEMVRRERPRLTVFAAVADRPGFLRKLDATLRELRQHGHTGPSLRQLADQPAARLDAVMQRKLRDLALLLDAWSQVTARPDAWDFEYIMHHAALNIPRARFITGAGPQDAAQVWLDATSSMSALEIRMLAGLGKHARQVTLTLLADPDSPAIQDLRAAPQENPSLFSRTERLHRRLIDAFRRHDVPIGPTLALRQRFRFADPMIRRAEAELLEDLPARPEPVSPAPLPASRAPASAATRAPAFSTTGKKKRQPEGPSLFDMLEASAPPAPVAGMVPTDPASPTPGIEVWESSDPETEVRAAAQAIREMVTAPGALLRYRQIALIVPDLDDAHAGAYQDAIRRIFAEHGIPHFIDARRGVAHHPLVELLRSAVALVTTRFDRDEMLLFLKTQLAGVSAEEVALLENYAIEHGLTHVPWDQPWNWIAPNQRAETPDERLPLSSHRRLARVNEIRARVWESLRGFVDALRAGDPGRSGDCHPRALRELLATLRVESRLNDWMESARRTGAQGAELAQVHQQVWREVTDLLALLESELASRTRTLAEFEALLSSALQNLTLGLIPPTVDQVLVSSVTRSRVPEMDTVIILGAVEGQFPRVVSEDPILSDAQREAFNALSSDPIGEGSDRQLLEMPFFDYVALTRARRRLIISRPIADRQGKALGASRHLRRLEELFGSAPATRQFDAGSRTRIDRMSTADDLLAGVTAWARRLTGAGQEVSPPADDLLMPAVYNWLIAQADPALAAARRQVWPCLGTPPAPALSQAMAGRFFPPQTPLRMSITQLEQFAACPLQYFVHQTLGLRPRAEFQLDFLSLGQLQHRILERFYLAVIGNQIDWPLCDRTAVTALLTREVDATINELHAEFAQRTPGYDKTRNRLIRGLGIMLEADRRRALQGELRPAAVEIYFGRGNRPEFHQDRLVSLPVLQLPGRSRTIQVSGKIDRMDLPESDDPLAVVIDYKSPARKSMDLYRVLHGISLQLPAYALVTRTLAGRDPIAALYVALGLKLKPVEEEREAADADADDFFQAFKPRGLMNSAHVWMLDRALSQAGAKSGWYAASFNKDGSSSKVGSDMLPGKDFQFLLDFTAYMIATLGDSLAAGVIAPTPYRCNKEIPCTYCDYASLCPFDQTRDDFREVLKEKPAVALAHMREKMGLQS